MASPGRLSLVSDKIASPACGRATPTACPSGGASGPGDAHDRPMDFGRPRGPWTCLDSTRALLVWLPSAKTDEVDHDEGVHDEQRDPTGTEPTRQFHDLERQQRHRRTDDEPAAPAVPSLECPPFEPRQHAVKHRGEGNHEDGPCGRRLEQPFRERQTPGGGRVALKPQRAEAFMNL